MLSLAIYGLLLPILYTFFLIAACVISYRLSQVSGDVEKLLNGLFCFVQTEDGKIVSVHHNPNERAQVVNFKKGIAAAFQANFKHTSVEVEEDTQSKHYSQYRLVIHVFDTHATICHLNAQLRKNCSRSRDNAPRRGFRKCDTVCS